MLTFISSAMSYYLLSQSTTMSILYLSKIPTVFQAGFLCAQVGVAQSVNDDKKRTAALGRLTMSYTVGAVIGPTLGGWMGANGDYYLGAKLAVVGSLLSAFLCIFMITPPSLATKTTGDSKFNSSGDGGDIAIPSSSSSEPVGFVAKIVDVIRLVWLILFSKVVTSVANSISSTTFPLILKDNFSMSEQNLGIVMSFMSGMSALVNGLLLGPIVDYTGGNLGSVNSTCLICMAIFTALQAILALPSSLALDTISNGLYSYLGIALVVSIFQYVLGTTLTSESTSRVADSSKGTLLGLEHSLFAVARVGGPFAGSLLLVSGGPSAACAIPALIFFGVYIIYSIFYVKKNAEHDVGGIDMINADEKDCLLMPTGDEEYRKKKSF